MKESHALMIAVQIQPAPVHAEVLSTCKYVLKLFACTYDMTNTCHS